MDRFGWYGAACLAFPLFAGQESEPLAHREQTPQGERIVVEPGVTALDFLKTGSEVLGRVYNWKADVDHQLRGTKITLTARAEVPVDEFESFFEQVLLAQDFVTIPPAEESSVPYRIVWLKGPERITLRSSALRVPAEKIAAFRNRGILISTTLPLRYLDAPRIANSLRVHFPDQQLESITAVGGSNAIEMTGFASTVAKHAAQIQSLDVAPDESAAVARPAAAEAETDVASRLKALEDAIAALRKEVADLAKAVRELRR